ncbi:class I SAM-dependent methyltransferase [Actinoplanes sp. CA-030573]|uniref:class I SAM-dependent methyltransferase n=1 Tax=Actinoplanes sp. CA-030573 TaxID=3239898 RepID=UPI003D8A5520
MAHQHLADLLDLDIDVLHDYHRAVIGWAGSLVPDRPRIVDLGAGSGAGTLSLARLLPTAEVTAVDVDEEMLDHLRRRAAATGVADRVRTIRADLDGEWPALGPADLVWASASMHHLADPARALTRVRDVLRPGGAFVVTEMDSFPRFLSGTADAALEDRLHEAAAQRRHEAGLHMGLDWGARLKAAGFELDGERRFDIKLPSPLPAKAVDYARATLERARHGLADQLDATDRAALERVITTLPEREDLTVHATRDVWTARRPQAG